MAVRSVTLAQTLTANSLRGPSDSIWGPSGKLNAGVASFVQDRALGFEVWDDFKIAGLSPATGSATGFTGDIPWYAYADTAGAITDAALVGGVIDLAGGTTDNAGVAIGSLTTAFQIITSGAVMQGRLAFETRVAMTTASLAATRTDYFIGLVDNAEKPAAAKPITATGGLLDTTGGLIGFHKRGGSTNATDWSFVYQLAGGTAVYATNLVNLVTTVTGAAPVGGTYYKLGFVFDPLANPIAISSASTGQTAGVVARPLIRVYVNGQPAAAFLTSTNVAGAAFPTTVMSPCIAFRMDNTTAAMSAQCDWIRVAQNSLM